MLTWTRPDLTFPLLFSHTLFNPSFNNDQYTLHSATFLLNFFTARHTLPITATASHDSSIQIQVLFLVQRTERPGLSLLKLAVTALASRGCRCNLAPLFLINAFTHRCSRPRHPLLLQLPGHLRHRRLLRNIATHGYNTIALGTSFTITSRIVDNTIHTRIRVAPSFSSSGRRVVNRPPCRRRVINHYRSIRIPPQCMITLLSFHRHRTRAFSQRIHYDRSRTPPRGRMSSSTLPTQTDPSKDLP